MTAMNLLRGLCLASILILPLAALARSDGSIDSRRGQVPSGRMTVKGTLSKMSDGERYWLVVRRDNLLFPKGPNDRARSECLFFGVWPACLPRSRSGLPFGTRVHI